MLEATIGPLLLFQMNDIDNKHWWSVSRNSTRHTRNDKYHMGAQNCTKLFL